MEIRETSLNLATAVVRGSAEDTVISYLSPLMPVRCHSSELGCSHASPLLDVVGLPHLPVASMMIFARVS